MSEEPMHHLKEVVLEPVVDACGGIVAQRFGVPGGWIYLPGGAPVFVPFPRHPDWTTDAPNVFRPAPLPPIGTNGSTLIARERDRQVAEEGHTWKMDDAFHESGQLARAAACYATPAHLQAYSAVDAFRRAETLVPALWPWPPEDWKPCPGDRIRELVKAGALIAAEIDRLLRAQERERAP